MSNSNWRERARAGMKETVNLIAEHGSSVGLGSAAILGTVAAGSMFMAMGADTESASTLYREGAATFLLTAFLKGSFWVGAEQFARSYLAVQGAATFDENWRSKAEEVGNSLRGAVPVTDDPTRGPEFQKALQAVIEGLDSNPEAKAFMIEVLKSSPEAREMLVNRRFNTGENPVSNLLKSANSLIREGGNSGAIAPGEGDPRPG